MTSRRAVVIIVVVGMLTFALAPGRATAAPCDETAATARIAVIDAQLAGEDRRVRRWELAWTITYAGLTAVQGVARAAEYTPLGEYDEVAGAGLEVGIAKSALGLIQHLVKPLRVVRPGSRTSDVCADVDAAERALAETGTREKKAFWRGHIGNLVVNIAGAVYIGLRYDAWGDGAKSFALGYPIGVLSSYTQPRGSWHALRVTAAPGYQGVAFAGVF